MMPKDSMVVMMPGLVVIMPLRSGAVVIMPACDMEHIAKVKSEAQRIDLKRFI
jgi:hypothetical protein